MAASDRSGDRRSNNHQVLFKHGFQEKKRFSTEISDYELLKIAQKQKPLSLTMDGVLDALEHFTSYASEKGGDNSNSAIFYLTTILYKNTTLNVKKKLINL